MPSESVARLVPNPTKAFDVNAGRGMAPASQALSVSALGALGVFPRIRLLDAASDEAPWTKKSYPVAKSVFCVAVTFGVSRIHTVAESVGGVAELCTALFTRAAALIESTLMPATYAGVAPLAAPATMRLPATVETPST